MIEVKEAIQAIKYTYKDLSRDTGLSLYTIRSYLKEVREPKEGSREKIAAVLRKQAATLEKMAEILDPRGPIPITTVPEPAPAVTYYDGNKYYAGNATPDVIWDNGTFGENRDD